MERRLERLEAAYQATMSPTVTEMLDSLATRYNLDHGDLMAEAERIQEMLDSEPGALTYEQVARLICGESDASVIQRYAIEIAAFMESEAA